MGKVPHPIARARQRLGVELPTGALAHLEAEVAEGRAKFVLGIDRDVSVWDVPWDGVMLRVVYRQSGKVILTVLSPKMVPGGDTIKRTLSKTERRREIHKVARRRR